MERIYAPKNRGARRKSNKTIANPDSRVPGCKWLKAAAPNLLEGLAKLEGKEGHRADLETPLTASGKAVEELLRQGLAAGGKIKSFKPHATAFAGYLISHEFYHRGQIAWTLKDLELWEWEVR